MIPKPRKLAFYRGGEKQLLEVNTGQMFEDQSQVSNPGWLMNSPFLSQFSQLIKIFHSLGPDKFPLVEQTFFPNHKPMVSAFLALLIFMIQDALTCLSPESLWVAHSLLPGYLAFTWEPSWPVLVGMSSAHWGKDQLPQRNFRQ